MEFNNLGLTEQEASYAIAAGKWIDENNEHTNEVLGRNISKVLKDNKRDLFYATIGEDKEPLVIFTDEKGGDIIASKKDIIKCFCGGMGIAVMAINTFIGGGADVGENEMNNAIEVVTLQMILKPLLLEVGEVYFDYNTVEFVDSEFMPLDISKYLKVGKWVSEALTAE